MDIYGFVNSDDVRTYLMDIGYDFSVLEATWLIKNCKNLTQSKRHGAWNELMQTMPDCFISGDANLISDNKLFEYLQKTMELENKMISEFYSCSGKCVYTCEAKFLHNGAHVSAWDPSCYSTVEKCIEGLKETYGEQDYTEFYITKQYIDVRKEARLKLTPDLQVISCKDEGITEKERSFLDSGLSSMSLSIPVPFTKGDILYAPFSDINPDEPFVFDHQGVDRLDREYQGFIQENKNPAMGATGYCVDWAKHLYKKTTDNYLDLAYYTLELTSEKVLLKKVSDFLKGEMDLVEYSDAVWHNEPR